MNSTLSAPTPASMTCSAASGSRRSDGRHPQGLPAGSGCTGRRPSNTLDGESRVKQPAKRLKRLAVQTDECLTIADLVSHYLQHARQRDRKPLGTGTYTLQLGYLENHIGPSEFGQRLPEQLEDGDFRRFMEEVRSGLAPASTIGVLKLLRAAFRWASTKGRVSENIAAPVASLISELREESASAPSKIPFERHEVEDLLRKAREFRPWLYPILRLAFSTGLRRGELLGLRWDDIDWPRGRNPPRTANQLAHAEA